MSRVILSGMQVLIEQHFVSDLAIVIENECIKNIIPKAMIHNHLPALHYELHHEHYLVPGFIDLHIHGTHGRDVMDATQESLLAMSRTLAADGVTGFLATTMSASNTAISAALKNIATMMSDKQGAAILGAHLEGPFISKTNCGAQCSDEVRLPDMKLLQQWQDENNNVIKKVTLAPELPGSLEMITALCKMGVIASIGHTHASYEETCDAIAFGCTQATHLFNAMGAIHQRQPGALTALLLANQIDAEIIVDGVHLHPAIVELVYRLKGKDGLFLVTDAMRAKCLGDGEYELGGQAVTVSKGEARLANGVLAGSTLRLPQAILNMVSFSKCSLVDAIYMASTNPAKALGLSDRKGTIAVGKDADLVVLDAAFDVHLTLRGGRAIFKKH